MTMYRPMGLYWGGGGIEGGVSKEGPILHVRL